MVEEEQVFSSKLSYTGIFLFKDFYTFCFNWLRDETQVSAFSEEKYSEKLSGNAKGLDIEWVATKDLTDYFRLKMKVVFAIRNMEQVKVKKEGVETDMNKGLVEVRLKGIIVKDYKNKFELNAFKKTLRGFYEKYIIQAAVKEFKQKIIDSCDEFLTQAKSFLDLEGRRG